MSRQKGCKICLSQTLPLDETGRCPSCRIAKAASDAGMTYGKFVSAGYTPPELIEPPEPPTTRRKRKVCPAPGIRPCAICGKSFRAKSQVNRFCSAECRKENQRRACRERYRKRVGLADRKCIVCGTPLPTGTHGSKKTCSPDCLTAYRRKQYREKKARYMAKVAAQAAEREEANGQP